MPMRPHVPGRRQCHEGSRIQQEQCHADGQRDAGANFGADHSHQDGQRSRRPIDLNVLCVQTLRAHHARQLEERLAAGPVWQDHGFVFTRRDGEPIRGTHVLANYFRPLLRLAGLPPVRFHDLRHTCATLLLMDGMNAKVVSKMLGHSSTSMTLDIYSHAFPDMQRDAASALDRLLRDDNADTREGNQAR